MIRWTLFFILFIPLVLYGQDGSIEGRIIDRSTQKPLHGANVLIEENIIGTNTDESGVYKFEHLAPGDYHLVVTYIGYKSIDTQFQIFPGKTNSLNFELVVSPLPLMEVTVISSRYEKQLMETTLPIGVIGSEKISSTVPVTIADVMKSEPGLCMQRDGIWGTSISIRGLAHNSIIALIDGNRIDTSTDLAAGLSMFDLQDIARIEIIKGAASSLYGSGAMGGVVNIITKEGWYQESIYAKIRFWGGYSSANRSTLGHLSFNTGGRNWRLASSGSLRNADKMRTPKGILPNSQFDDESWMVRLGIKPLKNHEIKLNYQHYYAHDVGIPGGYPLFPAQAEVRYPKEKRELVSFDYTVKNLLRILPNASIKIFSQNIVRQIENIPHQISTTPASENTPAKKISVLVIKPGATHETKGIQIQSAWFLIPQNYFILGLDAWQKDYHGYRTKETKIDILSSDGSVQKTTFRTIGELPLPDAFYRSVGIYLQDEYRMISDRLVFNIGGRLDQITIKNKQGVNPLYEVVDGVRNDHPDAQKVLWPATIDHTISWSTNVSTMVHATPNLDFLINLAKSFRSPTLDERFQYIDLGKTVKVGDPYLRPEVGNFIDFGVRVWFDHANFTGNLFYNRMIDLVTDVTGTFEERPALIKSNIGKAHLTGGDFRLELQPLKNNSIWAIASYVRGEDMTNNTPLPQIAPLNGMIGFNSGILSIATIEITAIMFGNQKRIAQGEIKTPGYTYFDLYINSKSFQIGNLKMSIMFGIENISDRAFRNHLATNRGAITIEPGRNFLCNWRAEFY